MVRREMYILAQGNILGRSNAVLRVQGRRGSPTPARHADRRAADARRRAQRSSAGRPTSADVAVVRPRQHDRRSLHRQLSGGTGSAGRAPCQCASGRGGADGICRGAGAGDRRFHPIALRRSSKPGPRRGGRGCRVGVRTQTAGAVVS